MSPVLKRIVFPVLSRTGYLRRTIGPGPAVVTYHGVLPAGYRLRNPILDGNLVNAGSLRQQLLLLKRNYDVISPDDFLHWIDSGSPLPPRSILLTCDDALRNTVSDMLPVLQDLRLSCLFFATGASLQPSPTMLWYEELYLMLLEASHPMTLHLPDASINVSISGSANLHSTWWKLVEHLSAFDVESRREFLAQIRSQLYLLENWKEKLTRDTALASRFLVLDVAGLRQLIAAGMTVGAHTLSHPILANASGDLVREEISGSRAALEQALGQSIWAFAYPFGNTATVTSREFKLAEDAGFRCAFMNEAGGFGAKINGYAVPRVHVTVDMGLPEFEANVTGFYRSLREKFMRNHESVSA